MPFKKGQSGNLKGRPKGIKPAKILEKEAAREALRQMVTAAMAPMVEAQIANAQGLKSLVYRDKKTGKFVPVKVGQLEALQESGERLEVWEDKPNVAAFTDLMNRALDKPTETLQAQVTVTTKIDDIIRAGRERLARGKRGNGHSTHP